MSKDLYRLPTAYYAAGVREYWIVDARSKPIVFKILARGATAFEHVPADEAGFRQSKVVGRKFRLIERQHARGHVAFDLLTRGEWHGQGSDCRCNEESHDVADVLIDRLRLDDNGRIRVQPIAKDYRHIYRSAMSVRWDLKSRELYTLPIKDFSPREELRQILAAVQQEYGDRLLTTRDSLFVDKPDKLTAELIRNPLD